MQMRGTVRWFDKEKGYGFIHPEVGGKDVFVHYSGIDSKGFRTLQQDQRVEFEVIQVSRGPQAVRVKIVS
jgi:CspA family cold shock protein